MKKEDKTPTTTKPAELVALEETHGTIHTIEGTDKAGNPVVMYLKNPDMKLKRMLFITLASIKESNQIEVLLNAGEMVLLGCYVGGVNMYNDEDLRIPAAMQAATIVDVNDTLRLKKN
jgi:hypothetical protein